jgi:hypothetical protein
MKGKGSIFGLIIIALLITAAHDGNSQGINKEIVFEHTTRKSNSMTSLSNYGVIGISAESITATNLWPRDSLTAYIFSGGFAFGCMKKNTNGEYRKMIELTHNINTGADGHFVPGAIVDGIKPDYDSPERFMAFSSLYYDRQTGAPVRQEAMDTRWPLWRANHKPRPGYYIYDESERTAADYPAGPSIISGEDIFAVYKDSDLSRRILPEDTLRARGYPLNLQIEQTAFTWGSEPHRDIIIIMYKIINFSDDTLSRCWFAPIYDPDIAPARTGFMGAGNDRMVARAIVSGHGEVEYAACWTDTSDLENTYRFGYLGVTALMRPAADEVGRLRSDKAYYRNQEQLSPPPLKYIPFPLDMSNDSELYDFLASEESSEEFGPGDIRLVLPTGPFDMMPGDTMKSAVMLAWAFPAFYEYANGQTEDLALLEEKILLGYDLFYNDIISGVRHISAAAAASISPPSPNPSSGAVSIGMEVPGPARMNLQLFSHTGKSTGIAIEKDLNKGANFINFDIGHLPSAAYILLIEIDGHKYFSIIHKTG